MGSQQHKMPKTRATSPSRVLKRDFVPPSKQNQPRWFSSNAEKAWTEKFFLYYSIYWISLFGLVVITNAYLDWKDTGYLVLSTIMILPSFLVPLLVPNNFSHKPITQRYWFKANIWIAIFSFIGNYFWTHYFFTVLGSSYTFPIKIKLNNIPVFCYLITHAYFISYHTFSSVILRRFWTCSFYQNSKSRFFQISMNVIVIALMAYITAFMEAFTIAKVPYYQHHDRQTMYLIGSCFYAIYFIVSFPMFYR